MAYIKQLPNEGPPRYRYCDYFMEPELSELENAINEYKNSSICRHEFIFVDREYRVTGPPITKYLLDAATPFCAVCSKRLEVEYPYIMELFSRGRWAGTEEH